MTRPTLSLGAPLAPGHRIIIPGTVAHRLQAPSPSGHGLRVPRASVSSQIPGFPARALAWVVRPRHVWGAARCAPHPSFPVRVRTYPLPHPPALCPEDLSIWRNGSCPPCHGSSLGACCLAPVLRPFFKGCAGRLNADVQTVPSDGSRPHPRSRAGCAVLMWYTAVCASRYIPVLDVLGVVGDCACRSRVVE